MQLASVEGRVCRRIYSCEEHKKDQVAAHAMIFVDAFGIIHATKQTGCVELGYTNRYLDNKEDVGDQAEDAVRGIEMDRGRVGRFVILNNDQACDKGGKSCQVERRVDVGTKLFLRGRVRGLEDENCLGSQKDAGGIEKLGQEEGQQRLQRWFRWGDI